MNKRIFIGFNNVAGYASRLFKAFKALGMNADLYLQGKHNFGFDIPDAKYIIYPKNIWLQRLYVRYFFIKSLIKYDAFIFISTDTLIKNNKDLKYFKLFGKKTIIIFAGCDVQQPELTFQPHIFYSACHNCPKEYKDLVGCYPETKILRTRRLEKYINIISGHPAICDALQREYLHIYQPINIEEFPENITISNNKKPVILHAPSHFDYKGTKYLINAVDKLKDEFDFEFKLVTNVKLNELYKEIQNADIVVDQLIQGWYGLLPLEAMMFKKPVICYVRDDVAKKFPSECPIINANPSTIYEVLKNTLNILINNPERIKKIGEDGRKYVIKYHDAKKIALQYAELINNK